MNSMKSWNPMLNYPNLGIKSNWHNVRSTFLVWSIWDITTEDQPGYTVNSDTVKDQHDAPLAIYSFTIGKSVVWATKKNTLKKKCGGNTNFTLRLVSIYLCPQAKVHTVWSVVLPFIQISLLLNLNLLTLRYLMLQDQKINLTSS